MCEAVAVLLLSRDLPHEAGGGGEGSEETERVHRQVEPCQRRGSNVRRATWPCDHKPMQRRGDGTTRRCGAAAIRRCGDMAKQRCGDVATWLELRVPPCGRGETCDSDAGFKLLRGGTVLRSEARRLDAVHHHREIDQSREHLERRLAHLKAVGQSSVETAFRYRRQSSVTGGNLPVVGTTGAQAADCWTAHHTTRCSVPIPAT